MNVRPVVAAFVVALVAFACAPQESPTETDGTWVGTITTEGNVTTVVNESGSVWGGTAMLVEEVSIGVEAGAGAYMFGAVAGVFATDEYIYVVDLQIPAIRAYDLDGNHVRDLGRLGQGPGEYERPASIAAIGHGRAFVHDAWGERINVYSAAGESVDTWSLPNAACCRYPLVLSANGVLRAPVYEWEETAEFPRYGARPFGASGPGGPVLWVPESDYDRRTISVQGSEREMVPFAPTLRWAIGPQGVISGVSDQYRFEVRRDDGATLVVHRYWEPAPIHPGQAEWHRKQTVAEIRTEVPGWNWQGDEIPLHQPAFDTLIPTASGEVWVARRGMSHRVDDCHEDPSNDPVLALPKPCWRSEGILDAFGIDGRYSGEVEIPPEFHPSSQNLFVRDDLVLAVIEDDTGTITVKRYRLVLPGEQ